MQRSCRMSLGRGEERQWRIASLAHWIPPLWTLWQPSSQAAAVGARHRGLFCFARQRVVHSFRAVTAAMRLRGDPRACARARAGERAFGEWAGGPACECRRARVSARSGRGLGDPCARARARAGERAGTCSCALLAGPGCAHGGSSRLLSGLCAYTGRHEKGIRPPRLRAGRGQSGLFAGAARASREVCVRPRGRHQVRGAAELAEGGAVVLRDPSREAPLQHGSGQVDLPLPRAHPLQVVVCVWGHLLPERFSDRPESPLGTGRSDGHTEIVRSQGGRHVVHAALILANIVRCRRSSLAWLDPPGPRTWSPKAQEDASIALQIQVR